MLGGVKSKIMIVLVGLSLLIVASIGISLFAFNAINSSFSTIANERVPEISTTTHLIESSGDLAELMMALNAAQNNRALTSVHDRVVERIGILRAETANFEGSARGEFTELIDKVEIDIKALEEARGKEFRTTAQIGATLDLLIALGKDASRRIKPLVKNAYTDAQSGSEETIDLVDGTLADLVDRKFEAVENTLLTRAEINLLTGISLAYISQSDPARKTELRQLAQVSLSALSSLLPKLQNQTNLSKGFEDIESATNFYSAIFAPEARSNVISQERVIEARRTVEIALTDALDEMILELETSASGAGVENERAIRQLMDVQVESIRTMLTLESALQQYISVAMTASFETRGPSLNSAQSKITKAAETLELAITPVDDTTLQQIVKQLIGAADPEKGIVPKQRSYLAAQETSHQIMLTSTESVHAISARAEEMVEQALRRIKGAGNDLSGLIQDSQNTLFVIAGIGCAILFTSLVLLQKTLIAPLLNLTATTERLAKGDMAAIEGLSGRTDEIGKMGDALSVFRENSLKVDELNRTNSEREEKEKLHRSAMFRELAEEIGTVVTSASIGDFSRRVDKVFDDPEIAKLGSDLNELMSATEKGLEETRIALRSIADADLTHRMPENFEGVFQQLAQDVNTTSVSLSDLIGKMREAASTSSVQAASFTEGAQKLATRAEHQAATLEETASAMEEMSETVRENSTSLNEAETLSASVAEKTTSGSAAAATAVENVELIQESSSKIHEIISVIENISFQTNLLALNAAVEAARAGEAGKGFAVVASEVRALAQRSTDAASEISELIRESSDRVEAGVRSVEAARESFTDIDSSVRPVIDLLSQIANSSREQALGISEVSQSVNRMDEMTQKNAQMADETTSMAGALTEKIKSLEEMASSFNILSAQHANITVSSEFAPPPETQNMAMASQSGPDEWGFENDTVENLETFDEDASDDMFRQIASENT